MRNTRNREGGEEGDQEEWQTVGPKQRAAVTRTHAVQSSCLSEIFGGQLRSEVRSAGSKPSATVQPFSLLQLDIASDRIRSVEEALKAFAAPEVVEGYRPSNAKVAQPDSAGIQDGKDLCAPPRVGAAPHAILFFLPPPLSRAFLSQPNQTVLASKTVKISALPHVLVLHLMRFSFSHSTAGSVKIHKPERRYSLFATVVHQGRDPSSGHYTADVRQPDGSWLRFDDARVLSVSAKRVLQEQAYLLLYQREGGRQ
ncbi:unnamed protein product [Closterium sp. NIES-64]|nr:unnamed protein product [Closterium sp. NIES-64]